MYVIQPSWVYLISVSSWNAFNSQISIQQTSVNIIQKERQETPLFLTDYHEMRFGDEGGGELRFCLSCGTLLGLFDQDFQRKNLDTDCCTKDRKILCCSARCRSAIPRSHHNKIIFTFNTLFQCFLETDSKYLIQVKNMPKIQKFDRIWHADIEVIFFTYEPFWPNFMIIIAYQFCIFYNFSNPSS